jgi:hypothetical protein
MLASNVPRSRDEHHPCRYREKNEELIHRILQRKSAKRRVYAISNRKYNLAPKAIPSSFDPEYSHRVVQVKTSLHVNMSINGADSHNPTHTAEER